MALDDDPTGTQAVSSAQVVCVPTEPAIAAAAAAPGTRSVHVLTNSRALAPAAARHATRDAAIAAAAALPGTRIVLRGDSTLRAHLLEEYLAYVEALSGGAHLPLVLVPALPVAGRVTRNGHHFVLRDGAAVPLEETEYALDPDLGYATANLPAWADERSGGLFPAADGLVVPLERLRNEGARAVADAIAHAARRAPVVVAVDAETEEDLELVAAGIRRAPPSCVRCAPTLVGALAGNLQRTLVAPPPAPAGTLVVCGSWVPLAARQLSALERRYPDASVRIDVAALLSGTGDAEIERAAAECRVRIADGGIAALSTPRERDLSLDTAQREQLAHRLARVVRALLGSVGTVVAKGGITSAVTARVGLATTRAAVAGPIAPGVALWLPSDGPHAGRPFAVVPGNVGDDGLLVEVVDRLWTPEGDPSRAGAVR